MCGVVTHAPPGGLNRLPCNYVLKRRVREALHRLGGDLPASVWCALCRNEALAIACCLICSVPLCTFCKEAHARQRQTGSHDVRYLSDLRANYQQQCEEQAAAGGGWGAAGGAGAASGRRATAAVGRVHPKCTLHPTHDLKLFCTQCQQVACSNCTVLLHRGHRCDPIAKAAKVYIKLVRTALDRTRPLCDYASEAVAKLGTHAKRVNQRADAVHADVEQFLVEYLAALDVHRQTLLKQIGRAREAKLQTIAEQRADLVKRCADARAAIEFADELLLNRPVDGVGCSEAEQLAFVGVLLRR